MTTPLYKSTTPLTPSDVTTYQTALDNLQGNLLKSHGRDLATHIFVSFTDTPDTARNFLAAMSLHVTSANEQQRQTERHAADPSRNELFTQTLISGAGYTYLGLDTSKFDPLFNAGMKAAGPRLMDPLPGAWDSAYQAEIHVLIVLADDDAYALDHRVREICGALSDIADIHVEPGQAVKNEDQRPIEHFGYVDGRSQPLFTTQDVSKEPTKADWDPSAGPSLILTKDPLGADDNDCGSYFVFRKLEQNVRGFKQQEQNLADALGLTGDARELAGAMVVGRFEDGTPVVLHNQAVVHNPGGTAAPIENDFVYPKADAAGSKCPFIGHIRKTNPRGDTTKFVTPEKEKSHRIARRGITYGPAVGPGEDISKMPTGGVGLLFQCCNSDLSQQFEFMQQTWADNVDFFPKKNGIDPVMGQSRNGFPAQQWPAPYGSTNRVSFGFNNFVTLKGGEYFYCPSVTFLRSLAG